MSIFFGGKQDGVFGRVLIIWARKDNSLPCATLFSDFSESKKSQKIFAAQTPQRKRSYICGWLIFAYFELKCVIFFKVQLCTDAFLRRKAVEKPFAAQTPQRKRGFLSTHQTIVGEISVHLQNFKSSLADAPHCSIMGFVQTLTFAKTKVIFYIFWQSTGHTFPTSSLSRDDYG